MLCVKNVFIIKASLTNSEELQRHQRQGSQAQTVKSAFKIYLNSLLD